MISSANTTYNKIIPIFIILSSIFYLWFAYDLVRTDHTKLFLLYFALFFFYYKIITSKGLSIRMLTAFSIGFRLLFLFSIPNLSQDFYRFIWDGRMIVEGFNPYLYTPQAFIDTNNFPVAQAQLLYEGMGALNASHFTNYPPINQLCFVLAAILSGKSILGSVVVLRSLIILADIGIIFYGRKLLKSFGLNEKNIFIFILNPLIIIELTGNLHFEGVMIFFLLWSLYLLKQAKWKKAGLIYSLSIATKLIPLMLLPLFWGWFTKLNWRFKIGASSEDKKYYNGTQKRDKPLGILKLIGFYLITIGSTLLLFLPFYSSEFVKNYAQTVGLWFQKFEFNASLYYIAREIGYGFRGYNEIAIIGKWNAIIVIIFILIITFLKNNKTMEKLISAMLICFSFFLFTTTTVHPWYIATLLALSVFTQFKFPLIWSATVMLSYLAYSNHGFSENPNVLILEYALVFGFLFWELFRNNKKVIPI